MSLGPLHPIWSVLTDDLVFELLDQVPYMTQFLSKALVRLVFILLQHPKVVASEQSPFYRDKSSPFWSTASSDCVPAASDPANDNNNNNNNIGQKK